ncbi:hypothetical protein QYF36_020097 [Acer negundo]|nr:hypothetical protein QYF36_020097 [Acer negundo]
MSKTLRELLHSEMEFKDTPKPEPETKTVNGFSAVDGDSTEQELKSAEEAFPCNCNDVSVDEATALDALEELQNELTSKNLDTPDKSSTTTPEKPSADFITIEALQNELTSKNLDTPDKSSTTTPEKPSADFITIEASRFAEESKENEDSASLDGEGSSGSLMKEILDSLQSGETVKPEKGKKKVRLQTGDSVLPDNVTLQPKATALKPCPSVGTNLEGFDAALRSTVGGPQANGESGGASMMEEAWEILKKSYVYFKGKPVGTFAAMDPNAEALNYNQVFVRDFVPTALACLMRIPPETEIVKNFLLKTLHLQDGCSMIDRRMGIYGYPIEIQALFYFALRIVTGFDPKNTRWSYHNGGSWPVLLWLLTAASIKIGRPQIAKRAIELVEQRLSKDGWPEYYDGKTGRYVGKQARKYQTWSIAGYLVAKLMVEDPSNLLMISLEEDKKISKPRLTRAASF